MKFWDASALLPLLVEEQSSGSLLTLLEHDAGLLAWWGSPIECVSALSRRERERALTVQQVTVAMARLMDLQSGWQEISPTDAVRQLAQRLLRVHPLRAADSLQLAAALVASEGHPESVGFVCLDEKLTEAARREGLAIAAF